MICKSRHLNAKANARAKASFPAAESHRWRRFKSASLVLGAFGLGCRAGPSSDTAEPEVENHDPSNQTAPPEAVHARYLWLFLHGLGDQGRHFAEASGWSRVAEARGDPWLAPDGALDSSGRRFWNAAAACCNFDSRPVDHVTELTALLRSAQAQHGIPVERTIAVGFSNGGFMVQRLLCEAPDVVATGVSLAGAHPELSCVSGVSRRLLLVHGLDDRVVPAGGGHLFGNPASPRVPSATAGLARWAELAACRTLENADRDLYPFVPGAETQITRYRECERGAVELWSIRKGEHWLPLSPRFSANALEFLL